MIGPHADTGDGHITARLSGIVVCALFLSALSLFSFFRTLSRSWQVNSPIDGIDACVLLLAGQTLFHFNLWLSENHFSAGFVLSTNFYWGTTNTERRLFRCGWWPLLLHMHCISTRTYYNYYICMQYMLNRIMSVVSAYRICSVVLWWPTNIYLMSCWMKWNSTALDIFIYSTHHFELCLMFYCSLLRYFWICVVRIEMGRWTLEVVTMIWLESWQ